MRTYRILNSRRKCEKAYFPVFVIGLMILIGSMSSVFAQGSGDEYRLNETFLKDFQSDLVSVCASPYKWKQKDVLTFTAVLGTGVLLYTADQDIHRWSQEQQNSSSEEIARHFSIFGHGAFLSALSATLYLSGELFDDSRLRKTALLSLESLGASTLIVLSMKFIVGRARPQSGKSWDTFRPFSTKTNFQSFPSGHSSGAFAVASVIASESDNFFVDTLSYSLASLVALSRIHNNKHWASDAFIGSAIGYFVGKKISSLHRNQKEGNMRVCLQVSLDSQGVSLSYSF